MIVVVALIDALTQNLALSILVEPIEIFSPFSVFSMASSIYASTAVLSVNVIVLSFSLLLSHRNFL